MPARRGGDGAEAPLAEQLSVVEARIAELSRGLDDSDVHRAHLLDLQNAHEELRVADEEIRAQHAEVERLLVVERDAALRQERLFAALPAATLVTDAATVIRTANPAACALLGMNQQAMSGKPLPALVDTRDRGLLRDSIRAASRGGDGFHIEVRLRTATLPPLRVELVAQASGTPQSAGRSLTILLLPVEQGVAAPSPGRSGLAGAFAQLSQLALRDRGTRRLLAAATGICARGLGEGAAVSITAGCPAGPDQLATSGGLAQELDGAQVIAAEGPCLSAWRHGRPLLSPDLAQDRRWPRLADRLTAGAVGGAIAVPLLRGEDPIGVFAMYAVHGRRLGDSDLRVVQLMAQTVSAVLQETERRAELETLAEQLEEALQSRAVIDQAKGMIMMRNRCDADNAFKWLVEMSSQANVKLRIIAQRIVDSAVHG